MDAKRRSCHQKQHIIRELARRQAASLHTMRLTSTVVLSTLCCTFQSAFASTAQVFLYDPQSQPRTNVQSRSLSPMEARLVLAQRAGVEDYHSSDLTSDGVIRAINDFGVRTPLFADKSDARRAFILVKDETNSESSMSSLQPFAGFQISPSPGSAASQDLFLDFAKQSNPEGFLQTSDADLLTLLKDTQSKSQTGDIFYPAQSAADAETLFTRLAESKKWTVTALVVPAGDSSAQWGTYEMPGAQTPLKQRRQFVEDGAAADTTFPAVQQSTATASAEDDNNNDGGGSSSRQAPLRGILPACFNSLSDCQAATRNCTGHGACRQKYHDTTTNQYCFSCACQASAGTTWAGPACQKKDVSVQFWLLALFTVALVGLISFAVGSVWEMGSEPLPSVIGAGVSGPTARK